MLPTHKLCPECRRKKPRAAFYANKLTKDQLGSYCKDCCRERRGVKRRQPWGRTGVLLDGKIVCRCCKRRKASSEFEGHSTHCRSCKAKKPPRKYQDRTPGTPARLKANRLARARQYSISPSQLDALERAAKGKCAICRRKAGQLHIDHCHKSGKIRALLCVNCNVGLGRFFDSPAILRRAIAYLLKHKGRGVTAALKLARCG